MGLFQNLIQTYEKSSDAVGVVKIEEDGSANEKKTLLPVCHMTFKSEICVTIDKWGKFVNATRDNKEITIVIPCTESSSGRSSGIAAHPLCDQIDYVGGIHEAKLNDYLSKLYSWKKSVVELNAIYDYVNGKTLIKDLMDSNLFKDSEYQLQNDEKVETQLDIEKIRKIGIRFSVLVDGDIINVWESKELRNLWISYLDNSINSDDLSFDYISGESIGMIATQHPKNINSNTGNAKLLSCNDSSGFTFRGRFAKQDDAVLIDFVQSQKMHQMLRWIIANYGYSVDSQVIVTWGVDSNTEVKVKAQYNSYELFGHMDTVETGVDILSKISLDIYADYSKKMKKILQGYGKADGIKQHYRKICIAVFDAATTGRMGLVFYQEFPENTYLESIVKWHTETSYFLTAWKKEKDEEGKDKNIPINYIGAPSYDDILFAVYGKSHGDKSYDVLKKKMRKQLLECMFGNVYFPRSLVQMAVNRSSNPMSFTDSSGKFSEKDWRRSINITCALARKYYKQQKEEIELALNPERRDRDYLYGRLLAVAEKLERTALFKADKQDTRPTNATRLMSAFQVKPYSTWGQIYTQLIPYKNQLNGAGYYQSLIDGIMALFKSDDYEDNSPLSPLYLLGYSAQNMELSKNNKNKNLEGIENDDIKE